MKWLQNNLPGVILASLCGFLVLVAALLALAAARPVSPGTVAAPELDLELEQRADPVELEPLGKYRVVTDRPLFNDSRRPVIEIEVNEQEEGDQAAEAVAEVKEAPKVSLTGVVITPELKLVSLTPQGGGEPLVFGEGRPMRGDYNGWTVSQISPRSATLESRDGQQVQLALTVHDELIKEPPKPRPQPSSSEQQADEDELGEDDPERLSRAEEIRQRIAERREQLRQEAEQEAATTDKPANDRESSAYAQAIRNLMNQGRDKKKEDDEEDDDDS